ncbi:MAG: protein kinase [Archangiaceae bacterium]|nr:protein kinase [Archangiaceae bacterium]
MGAAGTPLGRYLLGERLAIGGMGEVYVAVQRGLGDFEKPLAVKLLLPHLSEDPGAVAEFLNEARVASRLSHPNVVQIFDVGQEDGRYYIAMELVRGISLMGLLEKLQAVGEHVPAPLVTFIAHGLLDGLHHAHALADKDGKPVGLVHRDVSPHNVLVSVTGEVKLCDFGIARAQDTRGSTRTGSVKGKPAYLAPELFEGQAASRSTDVFSAAVTVFQTATLRSPFRRDTDAATMRAVMSEALPALGRADLPGALDQALRWGAANDPLDRAPTALVLREAIPTTYGPGAQRELGELVARVATEQVKSLESRAQRTAQLARSDTRATRQATASTAVSLDDAPASRRSRAPLALAAVAVLAVTAGGAWWAFSRGAPAPAPVVEAPVTPAETPPLPPPTPPPEVAAPQPERAEPAPRTRVTPPRARPEPLPSSAAAPRIGYLTVDAQPWATVSVRGKAIGDTPLYKVPLDEGEALVLLKNPDTGKQVVRKVKVVRGKETSMKVNLQ